jgi:hypothetical protein
MMTISSFFLVWWCSFLARAGQSAAATEGSRCREAATAVLFRPGWGQYL